MLVLMIVFGIHCNFLIVLPIQLKTCRSNSFFLFTRQNVRLKGFACLNARSASGAQFVQACTLSIKSSENL